MAENYIMPWVSRVDTDYFDHVIEEAAEVIQSIAKAKRFGLADCDPRNGVSNLRNIANEVGDLLEVLDRLCLPQHLIQEGRQRKRERLLVYGPHGTYLKER